MTFKQLPDIVPGLHQYGIQKWTADFFLSYLKKLGVEDNFCLSTDELGHSSDCMKAAEQPGNLAIQLQFGGSSNQKV